MDEVLKILGLASRARKLILGSDMLKDLSKVKLIFLASDISEKSKERFNKKAYYYQIDIIDIYDSDTLSKAIGKNNIKALGIIDEGFKNTIKDKIK